MQDGALVNLFYIGKRGGCQIICKVEKYSSKIIAHTINGDNFEVSERYFIEHTSEFKPTWLVIDDKLKEYLERMGIPVIKRDYKYEIPQVAYEGYQNSAFTEALTSWYVTPFFNTNEIFFRLSSGTGSEFFVNAERLRMCFRGKWEELINNIKPISEEEKIKFFKEPGINLEG